MEQKVSKKFLGLLATIGAFLMLPFVALGDNPISSGMSNISGLFPSSGGIAGSTSLVGSNGLIFNIINLMLIIAGSIAVLFLIIGGFWYITSAGNEEQAEKGKTTVVNAIIGVVVIVLSYVIIEVISNFVASGY